MTKIPKLVMAVPTAYTGASSIILLAAGTVVYRELRKVGTRRQLALAVTAMTGSSGVVLKPCLIVIIISILNKQVTTDALFFWGNKVFLLTVSTFFLYAMLIKKEPLRLTPFNQAWQPSLNNSPPSKRMSTSSTTISSSRPALPGWRRTSAT